MLLRWAFVALLRVGGCAGGDAAKKKNAQAVTAAIDPRANPFAGLEPTAAISGGSSSAKPYAIDFPLREKVRLSRSLLVS